MEKYLDEAILLKREKIKKEKYSSIEDGFFIAGKIIHFNYQKIMNNFSVYVPDNMGIMPSQLTKIKYPSEFRPQIIFTTLDLSTNLGFSLFYKKIPDDEIQKICERMMRAIKRENSDYRFFGCKNMQKIPGYRFSFKSPARESELFNMMLISQLDKHTILGNFNCLYSDYEQWEKLVLMIWETIQSINEGDELK